LIDATGAPAKPDMTVPVRNHRIVAVSPSSAITPTGRRDIFLPLFIANSVTGVRDMGLLFLMHRSAVPQRKQKLKSKGE
jgi:hypothetical protein